MTIVRSEQIKHCEQEKRFRNFHENFDLNVTAQELEQQPDLQWELLENDYSRYSELSGNMEKHGDNLSVEAPQYEEQVPQTKTFEGCVDHLLILAQSAEIVAEQSEDSVAGTHTNNQNQGLHSNPVDQMSQEYASNITADDQECSQELHAHVSSERCGLCYKVTRTRLTQIRKQARCKSLILNQERVEDNQCKHSQGKTLRLSQIKHQARCKSKNDLSPQMITGPTYEKPRRRILRLSQMKHQARSKDNSTVKEGTEEHMGVSQHYNRFKVNIDIHAVWICVPDSNLSVVEGVPVHNLAAVRWNDENLREHQRAARQLRAFKTKKLRQQLRTECIKTSANTKILTCREELPETSGCTEKLKPSYGADKLQGHHGSNESSGLICKSLQHIPNGLPVQNNVLLFTGFPNYIFQQCDTNMGWMLYMHHMQLKEYHRVVARQHRAERIEEKRTLKYKKQNSKNPVLGNSEAQKQSIPVKRLRLTQLRREARLGNQCSIIQGPAEN
ncbi:hypothetical protein SESBI_12278 [Sesbania bispinosa]|nr:hypothetical protein SESBI_12278 [Sesbania bispinosa]